MSKKPNITYAVGVLAWTPTQQSNSLDMFIDADLQATHIQNAVYRACLLSLTVKVIFWSSSVKKAISVNLKCEECGAGELTWHEISTLL